ncbi:SPJ_0845 family protein [Dellaglioa sp. P0083]|uniref:SPJ_0845 family protein n=1 Tax=Dellaglioa kimchii TaxID=3344667 RepID=UPI0038D4C341
MSLKIQRQDNLESLFDKFALDPKDPAKVELKSSETEEKPSSDVKESKPKK